MMNQNLASVHATPEQWTAVDNALDAIEQALLPAMVSLTPRQRQRINKMGDNSEAFCRKALEVMSQNVGILPAAFDLAEMRRDLESHDAFTRRLLRLTRLCERVRDTEMALGSDVMVAALGGYASLRMAGRSDSLNALRLELGRRFGGHGRRSTGSAPDPAGEGV